MIGIIAAVSVNGVIGQDNKIPFDYSEDTIIEVNGKTFKRNGDSWEEVKGGQ